MRDVSVIYGRLVSSIPKLEVATGIVACSLLSLKSHAISGATIGTVREVLASARDSKPHNRTRK
jgi:hypothetical protein